MTKRKKHDGRKNNHPPKGAGKDTQFGGIRANPKIQELPEKMAKEIVEVLSGNNHKEKFKTSKERQAACTALCKHLREGRDQKNFVLCDWKTLERYTEKYPADFPPEKIKEAIRAGRDLYETIMLGHITGQIPKGKEGVLVFALKNKLGWTDRTEIREVREVRVLGLPPSPFITGEKVAIEKMRAELTKEITAKLYAKQKT